MMQRNVNWPPPACTANTRGLAAQAARQASAVVLADLLHASRQRTLALLDAYEAALGPQLRVPQDPQLNPPLWEHGHIAWFQDYWIARNRQRALGIGCDPQHVRAISRRPQADAWYDSSRVAHSRRWSLPLPDLASTRSYLGEVLDETLELLALSAPDDAALYFYRLVLFHEDMHAEASVYMAQALGLPLGDALGDALYTAQPDADSPLPLQAIALQSLYVPAQEWLLGWQGKGFAFDNELANHPVALAAFEIDAAPVTWQQYFACAPPGLPRYVRRADTASGYEQQRLGRWQPLVPSAPAVHLSQAEAIAWCQWAGRSLPTEAQWECAALTQPQFQWGSVWEWTASPFAPYPGFVAHPYQDYSAPWFHTRPVLKGASLATSPRMAHPRYRNYFTPERTDIHAGFRSCRPCA